MADDDQDGTRTAVLFDLDGTLIDSVYQHVLAWREALETEGNCTRRRTSAMRRAFVPCRALRSCCAR